MKNGVLSLAAMLAAMAASAAAPSLAGTGELSGGICERLSPVAKGTGFAMDGYFVWCGSVIKVDDSYHMFASRWPVATKFPEGYRQNSEIVRAVASRPEGPYKFA
ncbi:MAG: hypothetical protein HZA91_16175, partial [Verrucomicrobia bacterium]|nr:hypothetical protein [Verrucomicrobiota bacterium]